MINKKNLIITGSYLWFVIAMLFCSIREHNASALSVFGLNEKTKYVFMSCIIGMSLVCLYIANTVEIRRLTKKWLVVAVRYGSVISSLSLIIVALIDMSNEVHFIFAAIYFILMPLLALIFGIIYWLGGDRTISKYLFIISISNFVISTILFTFVKSYLIAEITHTHFVFLYVFLISKQNN